eukprot:TRINITY_DN39296_c0_g1_i1.p1 TRINITY_DN39296_c0_g1~~TRINITY_DN39296_c0_g1_i1.p1  ORF type:complete len:663 (-),score=233.12 TRINITY_DN39296_c0_g1_i1:62-2050(-)
MCIRDSSPHSAESNPAEYFETTPHRIFFPSAAPYSTLKTISARHKEEGTITVGTSGIMLGFSVYNPTTETLAGVSVQLLEDITGHWKTYLTVNAVPQHIYTTTKQAHFWIQVFFEGTFMLLWSMLAAAFWKGMLRSWHFKLPKCFLTKKSFGKGFFQISLLAAPEYEHSPGDWRVFWINALVMHTLVMIDVTMWLVLNYKYQNLYRITQMDTSHLVSVYPAEGTNEHFDSQGPLDFATQYELVYREILEASSEICNLFHHYFVLAGLTTVFMTLRLFEYLHFQKKLSVITETFMHSMGELCHLFFVLSLTVSGFAFAMFMVLGGQVRAFNSFSKSIFNVSQMVFNMWKPKPNQLKYDVPVIAELLVLSFRLFVILLLLKMLFAMIFEGYKTVAQKKSKKGNSVLKDISELLWHLWNRIGMLSGSCYVDPVKIEVVLRDDSIKHIKTLTSVQLVGQLRKVFPNRKFGMAHAEWILNRYGKSDVLENSKEDYGSLNAPPTTEVANMILETFNDFDTDQSKTISQGELTRALHRMGLPEMKPGKMSQMLERLGNDPEDRTAELDLDQFCALLTGHKMDGTRFWDDEEEQIQRRKERKAAKKAKKDKKKPEKEVDSPSVSPKGKGSPAKKPPSVNPFESGTFEEVRVPIDRIQETITRNPSGSNGV